MFVDLQQQRHEADYNPLATFNKSEVERLVFDCRAVLKAFESAARNPRRSFAAHVLFRRRT